MIPLGETIMNVSLEALPHNLQKYAVIHLPEIAIRKPRGIHLLHLCSIHVVITAFLLLNKILSSNPFATNLWDLIMIVLDF
jgi:hypothetical protein